MVSQPNECLDYADMEEVQLAHDAVRLENWSIIIDYPTPYAAPEQAHEHLQGNVYGHPKFTDGTYITTTRIEHVDYDRQLVHTRNRHYHLGKPDAEYEAAYPHAHARLFTRMETPDATV